MQDTDQLSQDKRKPYEPHFEGTILYAKSFMYR